MSVQVVSGQAGVWLQDDERGHRLRPVLVRNADDGGLGDSGMLVEDVFDIARPHLVPADHDEVLLAIDQVDPTLIVDESDGPRAQPVRPESVRGFVGPIPIPRAHLRRVDNDLAAHTGRRATPATIVTVTPGSGRLMAVAPLPGSTGARTLGGTTTPADAVSVSP